MLLDQDLEEIALINFNLLSLAAAVDYLNSVFFFLMCFL